MAAWLTFSVGVLVLLVVLLVLTHLSTAVLHESTQSTDQSSTDQSSTDQSSLDQRSVNQSQTDQSPTDQSPTGQLSADHSLTDQHTDPRAAENGAENGAKNGAENGAENAVDTIEFDEPRATTNGPPATDDKPVGRSDHRPPDSVPELSTPALLANVVVTQGLFALLIGALAWYTAVPASAFGLGVDQVSASAVTTGLVVGGVLFTVSETTTRVCQQLGMEPPTMLREALTPETPGGWLVLFVVVLPLIAGFEELLFRGALIGVFGAGFDLPVWLLAIGSSVAFGLGHSAQGRLGMAITGILGLGLAGVFLWSGNLIVVIVAHYVINALEFGVHARGE